MFWDVSIGRILEGQLTAFFTSVSEENSQHKEYRYRDGGRDVCMSAGGYSLHLQKNLIFILFFFSRSAEFYYIYIWIYR